MESKDSVSGERAAEEQKGNPPAKESRKFFSMNWFGRVEQTLFHRTQERMVAKDVPPLHVPRLLRGGNRSAYSPRFISFGPYHYHSNKLEGHTEKLENGVYQYLSETVQNEYTRDHQEHDLIKTSAKEAYKVKFAALVSQLRSDHYGESLIRMDDIKTMITDRLPEIERFYDWKITDDNPAENENFVLMMMVDSLFLIHFLISGHDHGQHGIGIRCDILKMENQIPLFLLKQIYEEVIKPAGCERVCAGGGIEPLIYKDVRELLQAAYEKLSPFTVCLAPDDYAYAVRYYVYIPDTYATQLHLLGCIHAILSSFLTIQGDSVTPPPSIDHPTSFLTIQGDSVTPPPSIDHPTSERKLPIKTYTAGELARAGINFKSFAGKSNKIRFDKSSHTLYLPQMFLSSAQTEVFFRNLLALEFVDTRRSDTVTRFVQLTHCLISSPHDVHVLRKCQVISPRCLLTDEHIAGIWDSIRRPFSYGHVDPPGELKSAFDEVLNLSYRKAKFRMALSDCCQHYYEQYFSKPWNVVALLVGLFLLALNMVVAYCSVWGCNNSGGYMGKLHENL